MRITYKKAPSRNQSPRCQFPEPSNGVRAHGALRVHSDQLPTVKLALPMSHWAPSMDRWRFLGCNTTIPGHFGKPKACCLNNKWLKIVNGLNNGQTNLVIFCLAEYNPKNKNGMKESPRTLQVSNEFQAKSKPGKCLGSVFGKK